MQRILFFFLALIGYSSLFATYAYELSWENPASRSYVVSMTAEISNGKFTEFSVPLWRPGRYITQDYASAVSAFQAFDEKNQPLEWKKTDKDSWLVKNPSSGKITVQYKVYAGIQDAGSSYLCLEYAYFNPSNFFMFCSDRLEEPCSLFVKSMPKDWTVASALKKTAEHNRFWADTYHDFIDSPTILSGSLHSFERKINDTRYYFHFQGEYEGGTAAENAYLDGVSKIISKQVELFTEAPMQEYHFIYLLLPFNMRHAVEHSFSSCYALPLESMKNAASVKSMFAVTSHEFWHLWNVKRIRPAALWPYRYDKEQYTALHWFTEGVTDYYADLILVRAGLIDTAGFFASLEENISSMENSYATQIISPEQSSFDSWLSPSNYADPHLKTSYYPLGFRVGMLLDLGIRKQTAGKKSLDDVMRYLYQEYYKKGMGVPEAGVRAAVELISSSDWNTFFQDHVAGVKPISYSEYFDAFGLELKTEKLAEKPVWENLGIARIEKIEYGLYVSSVIPGSDAENAGIGDRDILLSVNEKPAAGESALEEIRQLKKGKEIEIAIFSNGIRRTVKLKYTTSINPLDYSLEIKSNQNAAQKKMLEDWLGGK